MKLAYGPVHSQRFGKSLGVNVLGEAKIRSFDCRYCDLGATTITMSRVRKEFQFPEPTAVVDAVRQALRKLPEPPDAITFSGNGEPSLHPDIEEIVSLVAAARNDLAPASKLIMLSNGAHLESRKVVTAMNLLDARVMKLDAGTDRTMKQLNAPLVRRNLTQLVSDLGKLKDCVIQSVFVNGGIDNTTQEELDEWIEMIGMIKPTAVQIMTLSRPPLDPALLAVDEDTLYSIAFKLKKRTQIEAEAFWHAIARAA